MTNWIDHVTICYNGNRGRPAEREVERFYPAWQILEDNARDLFAFYQNKLLAILVKFAIMYILT
ncbi:uncharacterized protein METZ01_LOCUS274259 [marine metagenome]|uniref:Uncharacterized protein n=1 Tax=marine metagenome TaxID=408172 RepID=A0A382KCT4_9ZZZZ